jgi:hypothetical protein
MLGANELTGAVAYDELMVAVAHTVVIHGFVQERVALDRLDATILTNLKEQL